MKTKQLVISILAVLFVFPVMGTFAQQAATSGSIEVITTFDYPGTGNNTLPQKINERGDIVGEFIDSSGVTRGFVRFSDGSFSAPIVDPNDTVGFTEGRGINNSRTVAGDYVMSDVYGSLVSTVWRHLHRIRSSRRAPDQPAWDKRARGPYWHVDPGNGIFQAFIDRGGTITSYSVPGALLTLAYEINNSKKLTVGSFVDASGVLHGQYPGPQWGAAFPDRSSGLRWDSPVWT